MLRPCIYTITNTATGAVYVGSTRRPANRWAGHRTDLRRGKHHCRPMQDAVNRYGLDILKFEIIEDVPEGENLESRERYHIGRLEPEYNRNIAPRVGDAPAYLPDGDWIPFADLVAAAGVAAYSVRLSLVVLGLHPIRHPHDTRRVLYRREWAALVHAHFAQERRA